MSTELLNEFTFFVLAVLVGIEVISKVPTILHTPLMSGPNTIHGIMLLGAIVLAVGARSVKMTAIPQMVALFNGVGGGAAALVAVSELLHFGRNPAIAEAFPSVFTIIIGSISFAGSMVAFAKLQELMTGTPITYPGQQVVNALIAAAILGFTVAVLFVTSGPGTFVPLLALALGLGVAFVLPIGGADMPVAISLL